MVFMNISKYQIYKMNWVKKLQNKWELHTIGQVIMVLIVFSCTGFSVLFIREPILYLFTNGSNEREWWHMALYILVILPIYNIILLVYGFIFGQFPFFWKYEQRMIRRFFFKKNK